MTSLEERTAVIERGEKYFKENKPQLLKEYNREYIAIIDNSVVDHDKNFSSLAERVYKKYGY